MNQQTQLSPSVSYQPIPTPARQFIPGVVGWSLREVIPDYRASSPSPLTPPASPDRGTPPLSVQEYPVESYLRAADRTALALRVCRDHISLPLAKVAAQLVRQSGWTSFGFARLEDHARERFGRSGRWVKDLAALAEALETLPGLDSAITGGDGGRPIGRVAALAIARVATVESLASWIALARTVTVRRLKESVREARERGASHPIDNPPTAASYTAPGGPIDDAGDTSTDGAGPGTAAPRAGDPDQPLDEAQRAQLADSEQADLDRVRLAVPKPVLAAFDETLDLYRAVEGHESTVTSFVESLVADAMAGECPPDAEQIPVRHGPGQEQIESALERSTDGWRHLPPPSGETSALQVAGDSLLQIDDVARRAGIGGPGEIDAQMRELVSLENTIDRRLGQLLAEMAGHQAWVRLRFSCTGHYAEERLGMARAAAGDRVRVERALRSLPLVRAAYEDGRIGLEAALLIARTLGGSPADRSTQALWIRWGIESTVKRLRDESRALRRRSGGLPPEGVSAGVPGFPLDDTSLHPSALVHDGTPSRPSPLPLDDGEWHRSLRREPGTARRRLHRFGLAAIGLSGADADGVDLSRPGDSSPDLDLSRPVTSSLDPDVFLQVRLPRDLATAFLGAIESARRRLGSEAEECAPDDVWNESSIPVQGIRPSLLAARMFSIRCRRTPAWTGLLALLEEFVETWDARDPSRGRSRDAIYIRDGWRCSAPGCSSRRNLEDHHLVYLSRGGGGGHSNRICLCRFHHQMGEHGGLASCRGKAPLAVVWRLGREPLASWFRNERRIEGQH
jgi:hypothetical protein